MPVRKVKKSHRSVTGFYFSHKLQRAVQFESALERDFILILDFHPVVRSFEEQPIRIPWTLDFEDQVYIPDFRVEFRTESSFLGRGTNRDWVIEVKYRDDLSRNWQTLRPKLKAGIRAARLRGWSFHVVTDREIRGTALANAIFLRKFLNPAIHEDRLSAICSALRRIGAATPAEVVEAISDHYGADEGYRAVWSAIAAGVVHFNIEAPLEPGAPIWVGTPAWLI
jgi:hypothetical protein